MNAAKCGRVFNFVYINLNNVKLHCMSLTIHLLYMHAGKVFVLFNSFSTKTLLGEIEYVYIYCDSVGNNITACFRVLT